MNRALVLTLVAMLGSVAAAVAAPDVDATPLPGCLDALAVSMVSTVDRSLSVASPGSRSEEATPQPSHDCGSELADRYLRWHHGSLKLVPACVAPTVPS